MLCFRSSFSHELHTAKTLCLDRAVEKGALGLQFLFQQGDALLEHKEVQKRESQACPKPAESLITELHLGQLNCCFQHSKNLPQLSLPSSRFYACALLWPAQCTVVAAVTVPASPVSRAGCRALLFTHCAAPQSGLCPGWYL